MSDRRGRAIEALSKGNQYLGCIIDDSVIWLKLVEGEDLSRDDAISFLLTRLDKELYQQP